MNENTIVWLKMYWYVPYLCSIPIIFIIGLILNKYFKWIKSWGDDPSDMPYLVAFGLYSIGCCLWPLILVSMIAFNIAMFLERNLSKLLPK